MILAGMSEVGDEGGAVSSRRGQTVAVIDDDAAICDSTRFLLETYDFEVSTYPSVTDFLRENPEVQCLIVDYHMLDQNGLELVSQLRARGSRVPTIMITATTDLAIERQAAELGIRHVLHKPLSAEALLAMSSFKRAYLTNRGVVANALCRRSRRVGAASRLARQHPALQRLLFTMLYEPVGLWSLPNRCPGCRADPKSS
jgi:FixJ family two-component response regulator